VSNHDTQYDPSVTEPSVVAETLVEVVPGVWHWHLADDRIGGSTSASHAVETPDGSVLIDPLPLADAALARLVPVAAICLTAQCHQRSAWRYRRRFDARVYAPETRPMEEEPDVHYRPGDILPGELRVVHTPGPEEAHYSFLLERQPGVLFCSDLLMITGGVLTFVPFEYHDDPQQTRRSTASLLSLDFDVLCLDHGEPVTADPKGAIRRLLDAAG
jgi:glyoxylase-like metal-dependent hydrolase (beta-lactamase superfamily II)